MSQSRASSHTTEIEVVTKAKPAVGKPKKLSKSSKYQVEKYYIDGILQKDKLPAHILGMLLCEQFLFCFVFVRDSFQLIN